MDGHVLCKKDTESNDFVIYDTSGKVVMTYEEFDAANDGKITEMMKDAYPIYDVSYGEPRNDGFAASDPESTEIHTSLNPEETLRFSDKEKHQIFLEPESLSLNETYIQGFSTSMPHEVQEEMIKTLPGFENAKIAKYAYAIEYDAINPMQLYPTLESKLVEGLFFGGQVNGTSGYEEAACQGLMAGINASLKLEGKEPLVLRRDEAYIGVLIDDLITKGVRDPYRMLTSRAEFRLLLRHDNSEQRLIEHGHNVGLISEERYNNYLSKEKQKADLIEVLKENTITPTLEVNEYFNNKNIALLTGRVSAYDLLKRPEIDFEDIKILFKDIVKERKEIELE
jgi:tRNA uridine 5-carboxymethylaminomethyl modification enzyme